MSLCTRYCGEFAGALDVCAREHPKYLDGKPFTWTSAVQHPVSARGGVWGVSQGEDIGSVKTRFHCPHDNVDWVASASSRDVSFEAIYDKRTRPQPLLMEGISEGLDLLRWLHGGFLVGLLLCFGSCALLNIYVLDDKGLCSLCERFM